MSLFSSLFLVFLLTFQASSNPQLIHISSKNQCIKSIVTMFVTSATCEQLSQQNKSKLALKMMNCLFLQMGKQQIKCENKNNCDLKGDSWNTFTNFFTHIDNLCHFYWDVSKAQRTEQMINALLASAQNTEQTLSKNSQNTKQILELQSALKIQILSSIATQEQMAQIITNSSIAINSLTSDISASLNKIHEDIDQNYAVVSRILSAVNQVLKHLDALQLFLVAQARSLQGILFFIVLTILVLIGCLVSLKVRRRKNQLLILISVHFLLEFFFATQINQVIGVQSMRTVSIILLIILVITSKQQKNQVQQALEIHLNSERISRIMQRALKKQRLAPLQFKKSSRKTQTPST